MNHDEGDLLLDEEGHAVDDRGVPLTVERACLMTEEELTRAVTEVIADLEATSYDDVKSWEAAEDGSIGIDSHLAVAVFHEFTGHLSAHNVDLGEVEQEKWTSIAGVVQVLLEAYRSIALSGKSK